jgi:preprotein translocase subunit SecG
MYYLLVGLYVTICLVLIVVVLLQQGKGGDIAAAFGGGGSQAAFGARAGATFLTKVTAGLALSFMVLALGLAIWGQRGPGSVVGGIDSPPEAPAGSTLPFGAPPPPPQPEPPDAEGETPPPGQP